MNRPRWRPGAMLICLISALGLSGCADPSQSYDVEGVYLGPAYGEEAIVVDHERIPGYMEPMRMTFRLAEGEVPPVLPVGEPIRFRLTVIGEEAFVDRIESLPGDPGTELVGEQEEVASTDSSDVPINRPE